MRSSRHDGVSFGTILTTTLAMAALMPAGARADAVGAQAAALPASASEKISVTAGRIQRAAASIDDRTQKLQKEPVAVTRVDEKELAAEHITSLQQATRLLPSVQLNVFNPRQTAINIRGLGANGTTPTDGIEGGVGVYVDGVYRARPASALADVADLDGITVLRGPAGTQGGMSMTAGAIEMTTALPSFRRQIYGEAGVGNYDYSRWRIGMTSALYKDKLAFRVSGTGLGNSGWVQNVHGTGSMFNGMTSRSVEAQLLYRPTEDLTVRIIGDYSHLREACCVGGIRSVVTRYNNGQPLLDNFYVQAGMAGYTPLAARKTPYTVDVDSPTSAQQEDMGLSAHIDWHTRLADISSITAYRQWNFYPENDGDGVGIPVVTGNSDQVKETQFTQEIRVSHRFGHLVDFTGGGFYMWQQDWVTSRTIYGSAAAPAMGLESLLGPLGQLALDGLQIQNTAQPTTNDYAAFASAVWHVLPRFDVTTGLRYDYETKTGTFDQWQYSPQNTGFLPPMYQAIIQEVRDGAGTVGRYGGHVDNGFVTGQIVGSYRITDQVMVYARYGRGQKSAGLNLVQLPTGVSPTVKSETDDDYEVGVKTTLLGHRLFLNGALYQMNDHDYQVSTVSALGSGILASYFGNARGARSRGAELDAHFNPLRDVSTSLSVDYNDAEFTSYANAPCPPEQGYQSVCNLSGTRIPFAPRWALAAAVQYSHSLAPLGLKRLVGMVGGSYSYRTQTNTTTNNSAYGWTPAYGTLNLNAGIRTESGSWELDAFIDNATNAHRVTQIYQSSAAPTLMQALVLQPLNFGFIVKARI